MDIKVTTPKGNVTSEFIFVTRMHDDEKVLHRYPKDILAIRAAEYDLEIDDPVVFDIVMLEYLIVEPEDQEFHPLFAEEEVSSALSIVRSRIDVVKQEHGAPEGDAGILFLAADDPASTPGLKISRDLHLSESDRSIRPWIKHRRDQVKKQVQHQMTQKKPTAAELYKQAALRDMHQWAIEEDRRRFPNARRS